MVDFDTAVKRDPFMEALIFDVAITGSRLLSFAACLPSLSQPVFLSEN